MKNKTENIDFKCPYYSDPFSQCSCITCEQMAKNEEESPIRKDLLEPYILAFVTYILLMLPYIIIIIENGIPK